MNRSSFLISICLVTVAVASCSEDKKLELGGSCSLNSDCTSPLVCKFGSCRKACMTSVDCDNGGHCVTVDGVAVCQTQAEFSCGANQTCSTGLVCRTADNTCRAPCTGTGGCLLGTQTCVGGTVCVDTTELAGNDASAGASDGAAGPDARTPPDAAVSPLDSSETESGSTPLVPCTGTPQTFTYDGTATPDSAAFASTWSTQVTSGASWTSNGSELIITSSTGAGAWFGNHASYDTVNWKLAVPGEGNSLSIRCRLGPNAQGYQAYFSEENGDGPSIWFMIGYVELRTGPSLYQRYDVDTSIYHTYQMSTDSRYFYFSIDDVPILHSKLPTAKPSEPYLIIGDPSGPDPGTFGWETGSFYIDEVIFRTHTFCIPN